MLRTHLRASTQRLGEFDPRRLFPKTPQFAFAALHQILAGRTTTTTDGRGPPRKLPNVQTPRRATPLGPSESSKTSLPRRNKHNTEMDDLTQGHWGWTPGRQNRKGGNRPWRPKTRTTKGGTGSAFRNPTSNHKGPTNRRPPRNCRLFGTNSSSGKAGIASCAIPRRVGRN